MMRQSEFKLKFNPELGRYTKQHIYGEGILDTLKLVGRKIFGQTIKKTAKKGAEKALQEASTKTGSYLGKKAGDKIVSMLEKDVKKQPKSSTPVAKKTTTKNNKLLQVAKKPTQKEINSRVNALFSGGKII